MKTCVPGRAYRMSDYPDHSSHVIDSSFLSPPTWIRHRARAKYFWDQNHETQQIAETNIAEFVDQIRVKESAKRNLIARPSTAVRRHVKKISEEFTITQTKYENSSRPNGIVIQIEPAINDKDDVTHPGALNSIFAPKIQNGRNFLRRITACSKCGPSKDVVLPLVTSPPVVLTNSKSTASLNKLSVQSANNSPSPRRGQNCISKSGSLSLSCSAPGGWGSCSKFRGCYGKPGSLPRLPRRKKSQSANAGLSGGLIKVPYEQVKKAKLFTEAAVREGKVFAVYGVFPAIREALLKRGWVEKVLHSVPYVNPHPQNCVCNHAGWHVTPPLLHQNSTTASHSPSTEVNSFTSTSPPSSSSSSPASSSSQSSTVEATDPLPTVTAVSLLTSETVIYNTLQPNPVDGYCQNNEDHIDSEIQGQNTSTDCSNEDNISVNWSDSTHSVREQRERIFTQQSISDSTSVAVTNYLDKNGQSLTETEVLKTENINQQNNGPRDQCDKEIDNVEYIKKMTKTINTAFLGPTEIREGIQKSINRKNLSIFQYSVPQYDRKRKSTYTKPDSEKKSHRTDEDENESDRNAEDATKNDNEKTVQESTDEEESQLDDKPAKQPYNPYPELDYILTDLDKPVIARVLRNIEPNFIWSWNRDSISFKHLSKEQLVNRFPNTPFTTKFGLCETLQQLHWFSEASSVDTFVPRGFCIGHEDERSAFIHDYRTTACLNMLKWIVEGSDNDGHHTVIHPLGEVPVRRIRQALMQVERFIQSCCHDDLDAPPLSPLRESEWDAILNAHHRLIHQGKRVKAPQHHIESLIRDCKTALDRVAPYWPQLQMDGVRNVWIVKPGAQSRGRGIFLLNRLDEILALVQSPLIYQTKYVVQKYMERPLLIHNTKFDIRQWFMVTDWNPLTVWMYKESYLRFCSQQYDLTNTDEAIHLSNNAIQCKYHNGIRDEELPKENMWDCRQFREYLSGRGHEDVYDEIIYPGMKDALISTMLAAQVEMDSFKHGFEFFGADFMLTEDFKPWLIEINSSPCMAATTSVTRRMCHESLHDTIKVVVDYRLNKNADTGRFELIYQDKEKSAANHSYLAVALQVVGRQIWRNQPKQDKRKQKKFRPPAPKVLKALPLITLQLEESGDVEPTKTCPILDCPNYSATGPTITAVIASKALSQICGALECLPNNQAEERQTVAALVEEEPENDAVPVEDEDCSASPEK